MKVELISYTQNPIETLYVVWMKSKFASFNMSVGDIQQKMVSDPGFEGKVLDIAKRVLAQNIPVGEHLDFVFILYDIPISLREQMVRHRIGVHVGDNYGVDVIPDLADSSFWSQSMRIKDMSKFADNKEFHTPESIKANAGAQREYDKCMLEIQDVYKMLLSSGIPMEDARNVLPLGCTMDISWKLNLSSLIHILGKRSCWILQHSLWEPIITGMIDELCDKIHPMFRNIILPPCFKDENFTGCVFMLENERRVSGEDKLPVCSLYWHNHMTPDNKQEHARKLPEMRTRMSELSDKYGELWGKNPYTGEIKREDSE